ncbi:MAG: GAF domain-containing protein, partial [Spirochaetaceae bacterium]
MTHAVIIDKSISTLVSHKKGKYHLLFVTEDIAGMANDLLHRYQGEQCCFLVFCGGGKVSQVCSSLSSQPRNTTSGMSIPRILYQLVVIATNTSDPMPGKKELQRIISYRSSQVSAREFQFLVKNSRTQFETHLLQEKVDEEYQFRLMDTNRDQQDLITIGRSLSLEKNPDRLFRKILSLSQKITGADAGTIYLVEETQDGQKQIRVKYAHTHSRQIQFEEAILPYNTSTISGYVACTGKVLNIPDAYKLTPKDPVSFNPRFDREHDYITKSMLVVPMKNHVDEIIGVIQLLNSKEKESEDSSSNHQDIILKTPEDFENKVVPFHHRYERLLEAVAGQAAIAVENIRMINQIEEQFEEFVRASVFAIESRDEATSGHSFRVAEMCMGMAYAINRDETGIFEKITFSETDIKELEYSALLHDYGKVYLDMRLFKKAKKLFPEDYNYLMRKIDLAYRTCELKFLSDEYRLVTDPSSGRDIAASRAILCEARKNMLDKIMKIRER